MFGVVGEAVGILHMSWTYEDIAEARRQIKAAVPGAVFYEGNYGFDLGVRLGKRACPVFECARWDLDDEGVYVDGGRMLEPAYRAKIEDVISWLNGGDTGSLKGWGILPLDPRHHMG